MRPALARLPDRDRLSAFCCKVWEQMKLPYASSFSTFIAQEALGGQPTKYRVALLWDKDEIVAALASMPMETDKGPGFTIVLVIVDQDRPDKMRLLDYLALFSGLQAIAEKRYAIVSRDVAKDYIYGRDSVGMKAEVIGREPGTNKPMQLGLSADVRDIVKFLLEKHPEWQLL